MYAGSEWLMRKKGTVHPKLKEENSKLFSNCFSNLDPRQTFSSRFLLLWWVFLHRTSVTPNDSIDKGFVVAHQPSRGRYQCCFFGGGEHVCVDVCELPKRCDHWISQKRQIHLRWRRQTFLFVDFDEFSL